MVERWHRCLKTALKSQLTQDWATTLPTVMMGLRSYVIPSVNSSPAELTIGTTLRLPGDYFEDSTPFHCSTTVDQLREKFRNIRPVPVEHHTTAKPFIHSDLRTASHVFIRHDGYRKPLQPIYDGPFPVISKQEKFFTIQLANGPDNITIDRLKPAFLLSDSDTSLSTETTSTSSCGVQRPVTPLPPTEDSSEHRPSPRTTTRSGRKVHFPSRFL